jgi:hypothetical protein
MDEGCASVAHSLAMAALQGRLTGQPRARDLVGRARPACPLLAAVLQFTRAFIPMHREALAKGQQQQQQGGTAAAAAEAAPRPAAQAAAGPRAGSMLPHGAAGPTQVVEEAVRDNNDDVSVQQGGSEGSGRRRPASSLTFRHWRGDGSDDDSGSDDNSDDDSDDDRSAGDGQANGAVKPEAPKGTKREYVSP